MAYEISGTKFTSWVAKAKPGSALEYHRGALSADCRDEAIEHEPPPGSALILRNTRRAVHEAHAAGLVTLVQKRHGDNDTSYIAIRRNKHVDE